MFTGREIIAAKYDGHASKDAGGFRISAKQARRRPASTALARLLHYLSQHDGSPVFRHLSRQADMASKLSALPYEAESCVSDRDAPAVTGPLDQESRIRAILKVRSGPLPEVGLERLRVYHAFLAIHLRFPFEARYAGDEIRYRQSAASMRPTVLVDPATTPHVESSGLICRAVQGAEVVDVPLVDLEVEADHPNCRLIEDYWYWFWNWRFDPKI